MSWHRDGVERVVGGTLVRFGKEVGDATMVHQTPSEVREIMRSAEEDLIELSHHGDTEIPVFIDRRNIVAMTPLWEVVNKS